MEVMCNGSCVRWRLCENVCDGDQEGPKKNGKKKEMQTDDSGICVAWKLTHML